MNFWNSPRSWFDGQRISLMRCSQKFRQLFFQIWYCSFWNRDFSASFIILEKSADVTFVSPQWIPLKKSRFTYCVMNKIYSSNAAISKSLFEFWITLSLIRFIIFGDDGCSSTSPEHTKFSATILHSGYLCLIYTCKIYRSWMYRTLRYRFSVPNICFVYNLFRT